MAVWIDEQHGEQASKLGKRPRRLAVNPNREAGCPSLHPNSSTRAITSTDRGDELEPIDPIADQGTIIGAAKRSTAPEHVDRLENAGLAGAVLPAHLRHALTARERGVSDVAKIGNGKAFDLQRIAPSVRYCVIGAWALRRIVRKNLAHPQVTRSRWRR